MTNNVGENSILYETSQEIWDATRETYSNIEDTAEAFQIKGSCMISVKETYLSLNISIV